VRVLFLKEVAGTAKPGDVKEVNAGYARNYLLPRHLAMVADGGALEQVRNRQEAALRRAQKELERARETEIRLRRSAVTIYAKAGEAGRIFGTVTSADIAQQLKRDAGVTVDKRQISIESPIRTLGPHEVTITLHPEITATVRIVVAAQ